MSGFNSVQTLRFALDGDEPLSLHALGNLEILQRSKLALFCSARCPGDIIVLTFDLAQALRESGRVIIGGFHTPMERECLELLLRGPSPVIVCPARAIERFRLPSSWRPVLEAGRLLVISPFDPAERRATSLLADRRNALVARLADEVLIAYAAPGSRTEAMARGLARRATPLLTLDAPSNAALVGLGARPVRPSSLRLQVEPADRGAAERPAAPLPLFGDDLNL